MPYHPAHRSRATSLAFVVVLLLLLAVLFVWAVAHGPADAVDLRRTTLPAALP